MMQGETVLTLKGSSTCQRLGLMLPKRLGLKQMEEPFDADLVRGLPRDLIDALNTAALVDYPTFD